MKKETFRTTQDDAREIQQIEKFGLIARLGRSNKYNPDADVVCEGTEHPVELKTFDKTKKSISTARGVTLEKIKAWREVDIWVFSEYEKPNSLTGNHWYAFPENMEPFFKKLEEKIWNGTEKLAALRDWEKARYILEKSDEMDEGTLKKLDYAFRHKGCALNDPKISKGYVDEHFTKFETGEELSEATRKQYHESR